MDLKPGTHHLTGIQALTLARTRENSCNAASNDLTREGYQQQILNGVSPGEEVVIVGGIGLDDKAKVKIITTQVEESDDEDQDAGK